MLQSTTIRLSLILGLCLLLATLSNSQCTVAIPFCVSCTSTTTCGVCTTGYLLNTDSTDCVACNYPNCKVCSAQGVCAECQDGFTVYNQIDCIACNQTNCATCNFANSCQFCQSGFSLTIVDGIGSCVACSVANCLSCSSPGSCGTCAANYNPGANGSCIFCAINQCKSCTSNSVCSLCNPGYTTSSSGTCVTCNIQNCQVCSFNGICSICVSPYFLAPNSTSCFACNIGNCLACSKDNVCQTCASGYSPNSPGSSCDSCNVDNCAICNGATECAVCRPGFILNSAAICISCGITNCGSCLIVNICTACLPGYVLNGNTCQGCTVNNCSQCDNTGTCKACATSYTLVNGLCVYCGISNCVSCSATGVCAECSEITTFYNTGSQCLFCDPSCQVCSDNGVCKICNDSNKKPDSIGQCQTCTVSQFCQSCTINNVCIACAAKYTLFQGNCFACSNVANCQTCSDDNFCQTCQTGYQLQPGSGTCNILCPQNCISCSKPNFCSTCANTTANLVLFNGVCAVCNLTDPAYANCVACSSDNVCSVCKSIKYIISPTTYTCIQCADPNCVSCDTPTSNCNQCVNSLYTVSGNKCISSCQLKNCQTCNNKGDTCIVCNQDYTSFNKLCYLCVNVANCALCSANNICGTCLNGYSQFNGTCISCSNSLCSTCSAPDVCSACIVGYSFNTSSTSTPCISCNVTGCTKCADTANVCTQCSNSSTLDTQNNLCIYLCADPNCMADSCLDTKICTACQSGFSLSTLGTCFACNISNCLTCFSTSVCATCDDLFQVINGTCVSCNVQFCDTCTKANTCSACNPNYNLLPNGTCKPFSCAVGNCSVCNASDACSTCLTGYSLSDNNTCVLCPNQNCQSCSEDGVCGDCIVGYQLIGGNCVSCNIPNCQSCLGSGLCGECDSGYAKISGVCLTQCDINCAFGSCNDYTGICYNCINGYVLDPATSNCFTCNLAGCLYCSANQFCASCGPNFVLTNGACVCNSNLGLIVTSVAGGASTCGCPVNQTVNQYNGGQCVPNPCNQPNCQGCNGEVCSACILGYFLANGNCILSCPVEFCSFCSTPGICRSCLNNLTVSTSGAYCLNCNVSNCKSCEVNNICKICNNGFTLTNGLCVSCPIPNCFACASSTTCSVCYGLYKPNATGQCMLCVAPCLTCNSDASCATCLRPFNPKPFNGTCLSCQDPYCSTCQSNLITCSLCMSGYTLNSNGKCSSACPSALCSSCNPNNTKICTMCIQGYYVNLTSNTCFQCNAAPACIQCLQTNPSICLLCNSGFYITSDNTCVSCPSYCSQCTSATNCLALNQILGQVITKINSQSVLASCDVGCLTCSIVSPLSCATCYPGYFLQPATFNSVAYCQACSSSNCMTCDSTLNNCLSCFPGQVLLTNATCQVCSTSCMTCSSSNPNICTSCPVGSVLFLNGTCLPLSQPNSCSLGCNSCLQSSNQNFMCTICSTGFMLFEGFCIPCPVGCAQCRSQDLGACLSCVPGYFFNAATQTCSSCNIPGCYNCNSLGCQQCHLGYTLSPTFTCQKKCLVPCSSCSSTDPTVCLSCVAGYVYDTSAAGNCKPDFSCNTNKNCAICPIGYSIFANTSSGTQGYLCVQCGPSCARCDPNLPNKCISCSLGSFITVNNTCKACPDGCMNCNSASSCFTCAMGYIPVQPGFVPAASAPNLGSAGNSVIYQPLTCIPCLSPCATCIYTSSSCFSCIAGFTLNGATCLPLNVISVTVTFTPTNNDLSVFSTNYYKIVTGLASSLNIGVNQIVISGLTYNNPANTNLQLIHRDNEHYIHAVTNSRVELTVKVGTSNSNSDAQTDTNTINQYFQNLNIPNLGVSFTNAVNPVPAPPPPPPDEGSNSSTIAAIVVPICLVVVIGVLTVVVCMRKRKSNLKGMQRNIQMDLKPEPKVEIKKELYPDNEIELEITDRPL